MSDDIVPQEEGQPKELAILDEMDGLLDDTLGSPVGLLDALSVFRPGKGAWFEIGDDKREKVYGIFLISRRPTRACWEKDDITGDPPRCWSIDGTRPHELVSDPYSELCQGCPQDALGSGKGRSKKCKTKGKDFILLLGMDDKAAARMEMSGECEIGLGDVIGPAMIDYSIGNRGASRAFQSWQRSVREQGHRPQGVITCWSFGEDQNKAGTDYDFVRMEMVAALPSPSDDPRIWAAILSAVKGLKEGQAEEVLIALSGSADDEPEA